MKTIAVDTNVLLDYFLEREHFYQAKKLIAKAASGALILYIPILVLLEFAWTLKSFYKVEKVIIIDRIKSIMELPNCEIPDRARTMKAFLIYENTPQINFDDCIIVLEAIYNKCSGIATSDKKLLTLYTKLKKDL